MKVKIEKQSDGMFRSVDFKNVTYAEIVVLLNALQSYSSPDAVAIASKLMAAMNQESMIVPGM
jgi:hypothetical protein